MDQRGEKNSIFRFDEPGALRKPGPLGRLVRLGLGGAGLFGVWQMIFRADIREVDNFSIWLWFAFGVWLLPAIVNIGLGVKWGLWRPRWVAAGLAAAAAGVSYFTEGTLLGTPVWWLMKGGIIYTFGHLGLSFVLSSILATPGCEMRSIPHLIGIISGKPRAEHYCPGFIDNVDRWETRLKKS